MHYKNGRAAKNGDVVLFLGGWPNPVIGTLREATAGNDACNGRLEPGGECPNLAECLHVDDVKAALAGDVPDTSAT